MSTHAFIGKRNNQGKITGIYVHNDGYPTGVGRTLLVHYDNSLDIDELIALGDLSTLGTTLPAGEEKTPDQCNSLADYFAQELGTIAYHRDRKEPWDQVRPQTYNNLEEVRASYQGAYIYIWEGDKWTIDGEELLASEVE